MLLIVEWLKVDIVNPVGGWLAILICLGGGFYQFRFAREIQQRTLDYYAQNPRAKAMNPFSHLAERNSMVVETRVSGIVMMVVGLLLLAVVTVQRLPRW